MKALWVVLAALALQGATFQAVADPNGTVLIRDATVHTMTAAGTLEHTDILISDGKIAAIGHGLDAPANAEIIAAGGRPVTPGLFGGIGHLGIEEIGEESTVDDYALKLGSMRPEFDVTMAFNPDSVVLGVNRIGGITFAMLAPSAEAGGKGSSSTIIAGQGSMARLDGTLEPAAHALFVAVGGDANALSPAVFLDFQPCRAVVVDRRLSVLAEFLRKAAESIAAGDRVVLHCRRED